jgi:hypothetical protein
MDDRAPGGTVGYRPVGQGADQGETLSAINRITALGRFDLFQGLECSLSLISLRGMEPARP